MADEEEAGHWRKLDRRQLLKLGLTAGAAGGVGLGVVLYDGGAEEGDDAALAPEQVFNPSVFVAIDTDGVTTVWVSRSEMGQGVATALPMILAEELDADWSTVRIEQAPASRSFGSQGTMASSSVRSMYDTLREAGAVARLMLVRAAAAAWEVTDESCRTEDGEVIHEASGRRSSYGVLASLAATLEVPSAPALRPASDHRRIGRGTPRLDARDKSTGVARYGIDVRLPGMIYASIERGAEIGSAVANVDDSRALVVQGVREVVRVAAGVAVLADDTWAAFSGRRALDVEWSRGPNAEITSDDVAASLRQATESAGVEVYRRGDASSALEGASRTIEAVFEVPYVAHQCMEPINVTARFDGERCAVWAPTQDPQRMQEVVAELTGLPLSQCHVEVTLLGGGFGRRTLPTELREVIELAQHTNPRPVQLVWTREDDVQHDHYRCAAAHRFEVGLDRAGAIVAWRDHIATPTRDGRRASGGEVDRLAVGGADGLPYEVANVEVRWSDVASPIPTGIWRSVGHSYNAFAVESMIDEVARATGRDPIELRLGLLAPDARERPVLERVREMSGWTEGAPEGRARGVAVHECFGSVCAQIAEVSIERDLPRVHRVWAAIECGIAINPLGIRAQVEGGIMFGLSAASSGEIRVTNGRVRATNFNDAPLLRIDQAPEIEVAIVDGGGRPGGVGEVGVPPIAPAVAAALARLRGEPVRKLPLNGSSRSATELVDSPVAAPG